VERRRSTGVASLKQHHSCLVVNHGAGDPLTKKVDQMFVLSMAAYNLVRMRSLGQIRPQLQ